MADTPPVNKRPILAVPLWFLEKQADYKFPYDEVASDLAKPLIAAGKAQDLRACFVWTLKKPGAVVAKPALTGLTATPATASVAAGADTTVTIGKTPAGAEDPTLTVTSSDETKATATVAGLVVTIHGVAAGSATITVHAGSITKDIATTVTAATTAGASADAPSESDDSVVTLQPAKADNLSAAKRARKATVAK